MKNAPLVALLAAGCQLSITIPDGKLQDVAKETCTVGHPTATFEGARVVGFSTGWFTDDQSVDVAVDYHGVMAKKTKTMTVRFHVDSLDPCTVHTEVLSDTGANPPVLLDNWVASPLVGEDVCTAFE